MKEFRPSGSGNNQLYSNIAQNLERTLKVKGTHSLVSKNSARMSYGFESMTAEDEANFDGEVVQAEAEIKEAVGDEEVWNEELTEGQKNAGLILAAASGDLDSYHAAATADVDDTTAILDASTPEENNLGLESYDSREIEKTLSVSIAFNMGAARQDEAMEAVFPTISVTADQAGLTLEVTRQMIHHYYTHLSQGKATNPLFEQKNLIDALIDSSILRNQATDIVPTYVAPTADNNVFNDEIGPFEVTQDNKSIQSGAFNFGVPINLISSATDTANDPFSVKDMTDTIDQLVSLDKLFLKVKDDASHESIIPIKVLDLPRTQMQKSPEGVDREMLLQFTTDSLSLVGSVLDKNGTPAEALEAFRTGAYSNWVIMLRTTASGELNLADGNGLFNKGPVSIERFYRSTTMPDGSTDLVPVTDDAEIKAAKAKITEMSLIGYTLDARFANLNRRERGLIVRTDTRRQKYLIPLQAPITAIKPTTDTASGYNVDSAVQATRATNTVAAIGMLMRMDEMLYNYRNSSIRTEPNTAIMGIGTWLVRPYYLRKTINLPDLINNQNSHTLSEDLSTHLTLLIRDQFAKAMMISGWMAAQRCQSTGGKEKPTAVIVTDPRIAAHLYVKGDTRLLGDQFTALPTVSDYLEFRNKIFVVVRREASVNSPDGLNWGNMFWLPELLTNMPIARNGQISNEFTVQTRRRHIVHCPIMLRFDIQKLDEVLDTKVPTAVVV